jgi:hypothetical protein
MAGDWIPIDLTLPGKPEVARLSVLLARPIDACLGTLIRFWIWYQSHTTDGTFHGMDVATMSLCSGVDEPFLAALQDVGWLQLSGDGRVSIPHFDRWFCEPAKRRMIDARRKRAERSKSDDSSASERPKLVRNLSASCPQNVRTFSDRSRTREEKRREYIYPPTHTPPKAAAPPANVAPPAAGVCEPDASAGLDGHGQEPQSHPTSEEPHPAVPGDPPAPAKANGHAAPSPVGQPLAVDLQAAPDDPDPKLREAAQKLQAAWNAIPDLPRVTKWPEKRVEALKARLRDPTWLADALAAIPLVGQQPFLRGEGDRGWQATIDWLLRSDTVTRILEGAYAGSGKRPAKSAMAWLNERLRASQSQEHRA